MNCCIFTLSVLFCVTLFDHVVSLSPLPPVVQREIAFRHLDETKSVTSTTENAKAALLRIHQLDQLHSPGKMSMMRINKGRIIELQELRELQIRDHDNEKVSTNAFDSGRNKAPAEAKVKAIESTRNEENKELGGERIRHPQKMKIGAFVRWRDRAPDEATVKTLAGMRNEENEEHVEEHTRDPDEIQIGAPVEMQSNEIDEKLHQPVAAAPNVRFAGIVRAVTIARAWNKLVQAPPPTREEKSLAKVTAAKKMREEYHAAAKMYESEIQHVGPGEQQKWKTEQIARIKDEVERLVPRGDLNKPAKMANVEGSLIKLIGGLGGNSNEEKHINV